jgi:hypothetical protein
MVITLLDFELIQTSYIRSKWKIILLKDKMDD